MRTTCVRFRMRFSRNFLTTDVMALARFALVIYFVWLQSAVPVDSAPIRDSHIMENQIGGDGTGFLDEITKKVPDLHRFAAIFNRYLESSRRLAAEGRPSGMSYLRDADFEDPGFRSDNDNGSDTEVNFKQPATHENSKIHKKNISNNTSRIPSKIPCFHVGSVSKKTNPNVCTKGKNKTATNQISTTDYPKTLNPFDSDHSIDSDANSGDDSISNHCKEHSEASDSLPDISEPMELSRRSPVQMDEQTGKDLQSTIFEGEKVEPTPDAFSKNSEVKNGNGKIASSRIDRDPPASKRLLKLHEKIASKGYCGPTGFLK